MTSQKPLRVAAVMQKELDFGGFRPPTDSDISLTCPNCTESQTLFQASISTDDGDTLYHCHTCGELVVVLTENAFGEWKGQVGDKYGEHYLRHKPDLIIPVVEAGSNICLVGHPDACIRRKAD